MHDDARDLVRWNHAVRLRFARYFETLPWRVLRENHETSHLNIANVFMHGCNMEDWYLHYVLPKKAWAGPKYDGFRSARAMRVRVQEVNRKGERFLRTLKRPSLARPADLSALGKDAAKDITLGDLLVELVTEDVHHRGEILAMLWRKDLQPPDVSFTGWAAAERASNGRSRRRARR